MNKDELELINFLPGTNQSDFEHPPKRNPHDLIYKFWGTVHKAPNLT